MPRHKLVLCLRNAGYEASLERRKIYEAIPDRAVAAQRQVRVIDESGEDYVYPAAMFAPIQLPVALRRAMLRAEEGPGSPLDGFARQAAHRVLDRSAW